VLLDRGRFYPLAELLDIRCDVERLDLIERADSTRIAPMQKRGGNAPVCGARVRIGRRRVVWRRRRIGKLVRVDSPLTADERRKIDTAITAVEQSTSADLDVMVTRASDRYSLYPVVWAGISALAVAGIAALLRPGLNGRSVIIVQLLVVIVLTALCDWMPIRLWLVPTHVKHAHARQLAHREFRAHFAGDKATRKCILFFVSLGEHYVEIIADHETHAHRHTVARPRSRVGQWREMSTHDLPLPTLFDEDQGSSTVESLDLPVFGHSGKRVVSVDDSRVFVKNTRR
jgi:uncharacterized membrane protein